MLGVYLLKWSTTALYIGEKRVYANPLAESWVRGNGQPPYQQWRSEDCSTSPPASSVWVYLSAELKMKHGVNVQKILLLPKHIHGIGKCIEANNEKQYSNTHCFICW